jgi:hypothetical protein
LCSTPASSIKQDNPNPGQLQESTDMQTKPSVPQDWYGGCSLSNTYQISPHLMGWRNRGFDESQQEADGSAMQGIPGNTSHINDYYGRDPNQGNENEN